MDAIAAIVIFVLMFALIILDKIPRHYITLGCAAATLIIVFGVCMKSPQAIMETLNLKTLIFFTHILSRSSFKTQKFTYFFMHIISNQT